MKFSVVIPTCDRPATLAACLQRLAPGQQSLPAAEYEVIVSDDGATEPVAALLARDFPWVRWTAGPRRGPAANRNHGARLARGEWHVFTDDDCLPSPGWLAAFAQASAAPGVAVLEGRTYANGPRVHPLDDSPINDTGGNLWACNFAIRREQFQIVSGFDERFLYPSMEDTELRLRLEAAGYKAAFVPAAAVLHPWRRIANWRVHHRRQMKSRLLLAEIHPDHEFSIPWPHLLRHHLRIAARVHLPFLRSRPREAWRVLPALWGSVARELLWRWRRPRADEFEV